jgi:hypothetical protein
MRDADAIALEAEYWQHVLDDLKDLNALIGYSADGLLEVMGRLLQSMSLEHAETVALGMERVNDVLGYLREMQTALMKVGELAGGRVQVLEREIQELRE